MGDIDELLTDEELKVLYLFVDGGSRLKCFRQVFPDSGLPDWKIYKWFRREDIVNMIIQIGNELSIYDTVCDKVLLEIITASDSQDRDKINAIKTWNALRDRVHTTIKLESETKLDLTNVSTENLGALVEAVMKEVNGTGSTDADN